MRERDCDCDGGMWIESSTIFRSVPPAVTPEGGLEVWSSGFKMHHIQTSNIQVLIQRGEKKKKKDSRCSAQKSPILCATVDTRINSLDLLNM